jgi:superfamily II DNA or RNA helicase
MENSIFLVFLNVAGECFRLLKERWDPLVQRYIREYNKISSEKHAPLCPRLYQTEMVQFAASRNALLVAPTGCGKTKIIAMLLDEMWRNNPSAKVLVETLFHTHSS